jgi:hypothetical protein
MSLSLLPSYISSMGYPIYSNYSGDNGGEMSPKGTEVDNP